MPTKPGRALSGGLFSLLVSGLLLGVSAPAEACHKYVSERTGETGCTAKKADQLYAKSAQSSSSVETSKSSNDTKKDASVSSGRAGTTTGSNSTWDSGMSCAGLDMRSIEQWRGREVTVRHTWAGKTLESAVQFFKKSPYRKYVQENRKKIVIAVPMVTAGGSLSECAAGRYDGYFRAIGEALAANGRPDTILSLGWEFNVTSWPWSAVRKEEDFKACWRRAVGVVRSVAPQARFAWTLASGNKLQDWRDAYPGDEWVDVIGVHYYDRWPPTPTQREWDAIASNPPDLRRRTGIETVVAFARERGKTFGVGEWAVSDGLFGGSDNPLFIENMYGVFKRNADIVEYESYFNCGDRNVYGVWPPSVNPRASEKYRELW